MSTSTITEPQSSDEISLKELIHRMQEWAGFLKTKWIIIVVACVLGGIVGWGYAWVQKIKYTATLTFVLDEEKAGGSAMAGAFGLASSLGIDVGGSVGSTFSGANLIELMKSRSLIQKALLHPAFLENNKQSLADYYIQFTGLNKTWSNNLMLSKLHFDPLGDPNRFTTQHDSVMRILWKRIVDPGGVLSVSQKDKKVSIVTVESKCEDEHFAKMFTETIARVVSDFYVETKSKKARQNFEILQKQTDSVRQELNKAIAGVAVANDNTYNLNPALNIRRTPSAQRQIDVQANTAVLMQLIPSLEMAKVSLRRETPLIQVIDRPVFPLEKVKPGRLKTMLLVGISSGFLITILLIVEELLKRLMRN